VTAWRWLRRQPVLYLWLPLLVWMGLIYYLSAQPDLPQAGMGWADLLISSLAHVSVFGALAVLWARALGSRRHAWLLAFTLTVLYALSDEFHQSFVPGRKPDPWDLLCDAFGAAMGLLAWTWWRRRQPAATSASSTDLPKQAE
jgi:VanZ family protein